MTKTKKETTKICPSIERKPGCIEAALSIIGDKWSGLLIGQMVGDPRTFGELGDCLPGISPRTLSQRMEKLQEKKIVEKEIYCKNPPRYRYKLTKKGHELREVLIKMADWGEKYGE